MRRLSVQRGVSLIEALVALVVLAIGSIAYVGMQGNLRLNGDVARQRSEAVRIAQAAIESWRAYRTLAPDAALTDYVEIATVGDMPVTGTNATYTLKRTVIDADTDAAAPRLKTVVVDVRWTDRAADIHSVRLSTAIAASPPELAGTLSVPPGGQTLLQP